MTCRNLFIVTVGVLLLGCTNQSSEPTYIPRSSVHVGMTLGEVYSEYGFSDVDSFSRIPGFVFEAIREEEEDSCIFQTYRHLLMTSGKLEPFVLTFQRRLLSEEEFQRLIKPAKEQQERCKAIPEKAWQEFFSKNNMTNPKTIAEVKQLLFCDIDFNSRIFHYSEPILIIIRED